jgi:hypothetical protein
MMTNEENFESDDPHVLEDSWEQEEARIEARRTFPVLYEYVADTEDGPKVTSIDLTTLTLEELEGLIPYNKYAYLEILHRELRNTD